jgi:hypothetical protein
MATLIDEGGAAAPPPSGTGELLVVSLITSVKVSGVFFWFGVIVSKNNQITVLSSKTILV